MDVKSNGGPHEEAWLPWEDSKTPANDKALYRTPYSKALLHCKNEIETEEKWDDFKKITNPYEYVFLSWNRRSSRSVSTRQPLSRSYFKMIEMWQAYGMADIVAPLVARDDNSLRTAHAAEGPGGFIEACWEQAGRRGWPVSQSHAITLRSDAKNIPGWRKAARFLADRPQIQVSDGADGTGNILLKANQDAYIDQVRQQAPLGVHLYTADGGFDFSSDYNAQEDVIFPLLLAESLLGLRSLSKGGVFVLKCFDTTEYATLDLLWILSRCFETWVVTKPKTSRAGNAERYFIGLRYLGEMSDTIAFLENIQARQTWVGRLFKPPETPTYKGWLASMLDLQERIEQQEYATISKTLQLIRAHDFAGIRVLVRENIHRSMEWCRQFGEPLSSIWGSEFDRNITREVQDLLQILSPGVGANNGIFSHNVWYSRNRATSSGQPLSFEGFRTGRVEPVYALTPEQTNLFRGTKGTS